MHANVPARYVCDDDFNLGGWVQNIRRLYKDNALSDDQKAELEKWDFSWNITEDNWKEMYDALKRYYEEYGNIDINSKYIDADGNALGRWLTWQRRHYKTGTLKNYKIQKLEELGMKWETNRGYSFDDYVEMLKEYYRRYGDVKVSCNYKTEDDVALGNWVTTMRNRRKNGLLKQEQIDILDDCHMIWSLAKRGNESYEVKYKKWMQYYCIAKDYYDKNGNLYVPSDYESEDGFDLYTWITRQRKNARSSDQTKRLSLQQFKLLSDIGMDWMTINERKWEIAYSYAADYYEQFGDIDVPSKYYTEDGFCLGKWINIQRKKYHKKNGELTDYNIKRLEILDMEWEITGFDDFA